MIITILINMHIAIAKFIYNLDCEKKWNSSSNNNIYLFRSLLGRVAKQNNMQNIYMLMCLLFQYKNPFEPRPILNWLKLVITVIASDTERRDTPRNPHWTKLRKSWRCKNCSDNARKTREKCLKIAGRTIEITS